MSSLPLKGIKVLDLSRILAGPYATQILGDLGAQVIKIEKPDGDDTRKWGPPFISQDGEESAAYFYSTNRNKRSLALDFKDKEDLEHLDQLISQADFLIENFKPGTLKKMNLDFEALHKKYPRLIYCSISSFGEDSPHRELPGYDALIQAMGGLMSITGPNENTPTRAGVAITDITTGLYSVIGFLSALHERNSSGKGQKIDLSLMDTQVSWLANVGMNFLSTGKTPIPYGTAHPNIVPYQAFQCSDKALYLAIGNDTQFEKLSKTMKQNWHENPDWKTNSGRVKNREHLIPELEKAFSSKPCAEWLNIIQSAGLPCGPINNLKELSDDPHVKNRELFTTMSDSDVPCIKNPLQFSRTPISEYKTPPKKPEAEKFDFSIFD